MKYLAILAIGSLAVALPSPALAQENDLEKLFRGMEKKLLAAKAFEVTFDYQVGERKAKGELLVTQDNKVRLKVVGHFEDQPNAGFELVSDGKQLKIKGAKFFLNANGQPRVQAGGQSEGQTPKNFHTMLGNTLSRGGVWYSILVMPCLCLGDGEINPDREESRMRVRDFTLVGTEKVGAKEAKVIRYLFGNGSDRNDEEITIWIDAKTQLPLRRSSALGGTRMVENYREFRFDPQIDAKAFEFPK